MKLSRYITLILLAGTLASCTDERFYPNSYVFLGEPQKGETDPKKLNLSITPANFDFSMQSLQSINHTRFTIHNDGDVEVRDLTFKTRGDSTFTIRNGFYPGSDSRCADRILPGQTCTVDVTYRPTGLARSSGDLDVGFHSSGVLNAGLDGYGSDIATLRFDNSRQLEETYFGKVAPNTPVDHTIWVRYYGAKAATGLAFSLIRAPFQLVQNTCPAEIQGNDCKLVVRFSAASGAHSLKLKIGYHNGSYAGEDNHLLLGEIEPVVSPAVLTLDPNAGAFGRRRLGQPSVKAIQLTKTGSLPASGVRYSLTGSSAFRIENNPCGATVASNCDISVEFLPTSTAGVTAQLHVDYEDGRGRTARSSLALSGSGGSLAVLSLLPVSNPISFGNLLPRQSRQLPFTLVNAAESIQATSISLSFPAGAQEYSLAQGCPASLNSGASCAPILKWTPAESGVRNGKFRVTYFNGEKSISFERSLVGTADEGSGLSSNATLDFGNVFVNASKTLDLNVSFVGSAGATDVSFASSEAAFKSVAGGTCGTVVDGSCLYKIQFSPVAAVAYTGTGTISYTDALGVRKTTSTTLRGTGINRALAIVTADTASTNFGDVRIGGVKNLKITLRHSGDIVASNLNVVLPQPPGQNVFSFSGGYPGSGGTCGNSLGPSSRTCTLSIDFRPGTTDLALATVTTSYHNGSSLQSFTHSLSGRGSQIASIGNAAIAFPDTGVDGFVSGTASISNTGNRSATSVVIGALSAPFTLLSSSCGATIAAGANCQIHVRFSPRTPKNHSATVNIAYSDNGVTKQAVLGLSGNGTISGFVKVNGYHTCARTPMGQLKCWGANNYGQLGLGDTLNRGSGSGEMGTSLPVIALGANRWVKDVAIGYWHTCAILDNNETKCWGANHYGQLGIGSPASAVGVGSGEMGDALPAVNLGAGLYAVSLSLGYAHSCALLNNGRVKCWGQNDEGQLGLGDVRNRGRTAADMSSLPFVELGRSATQIATDSSHVCALLDNASVRCWGNNFFGQLGTGDQANRGDNAGEMGTALPVVALGTSFTPAQVVTGGAYTCVRSTAGSVKCFGRNEAGILGRLYCQDSDGRMGLCGDSRFPLDVRSYGIRPTELGDALAPIELGTGVTVRSLSAGNSHVCAHTADNQIKCWGQNTFGQLGYGDTESRGIRPNQMGDALLKLPFTGALETFVSGGFHNCVRFTNKTVKCFGQNRFGNLGLGDTSDRGDEPGETGDSLPNVSF